VALALLRAWFIIFICGKVLFLHKRNLFGCIDRRIEIAHMILCFAFAFAFAFAFSACRVSDREDYRSDQGSVCVIQYVGSDRFKVILS